MSSTSCHASCLQVVALGAGEGPARPGEAAAKFSTSRYSVIFVKPTGIFNCSALPLRGTFRRIGRLVIYYPHAIEYLLLLYLHSTIKRYPVPSVYASEYYSEHSCSPEPVTLERSFAEDPLAGIRPSGGFSTSTSPLRRFRKKSFISSDASSAKTPPAISKVW